MGLFTLEEPVWETKGRNAGRMVTRGPGDGSRRLAPALTAAGLGAYKLPSFNDIPLDFRVKLLQGSEQPQVPQMPRRELPYF